MFYGISPWLLSVEVPLYAAGFPVNPFYSLPLDTYFAANSVGHWAGTWMHPFTSGYSGYRFADQAPNYLYNQPSGGYPTDVASRAVDYIRSALNGTVLPQYNRPATAYDAYNANQHADIARGEQWAGAEGREKAVWNLADTLKEWVNKGDRRADYNAALQDIVKSGKGLAVKLANLISPGATDVTEDVARMVAQLLRPAEVPADKTPHTIMWAYIQKLGGEQVVDTVLDETWRWVNGYGIPTMDPETYKDKLKEKGFERADARALYSHLDRKGMSDAEKRIFMNRLDPVDTKDQDDYDTSARVAVLRAWGVRSKKKAEEVLKKYKDDNFEKFMDGASQEVGNA